MSWDMKHLEWSYIGTETNFVPEVPIKIKTQGVKSFLFIYLLYSDVFINGNL